MPESSQYRLEDLKLRWQRDPSSRLFLQLADEHRKLGQLAEAVAVLEQGLEHRPNELSALVALGRLRLETDQAGEAVGPLQAVVFRDPTHIVANKLLLEAHLQCGDAIKAGERLETYRLLNDRDPELDHLAYRLERLLAEEDEAATVVAAEAPEPDDAGEIEDGGSAGEELLEVAAADEAAEPVAAEADEAAEPVVAEPVAAEPVAAEPVAAEPVEQKPVESPAAASEPVEAAAVAETAPAEAPFDQEPVTREAAPAAAAPQPAGSELFQLGGELPAPDIGGLWQHPPAKSPGLSEPFGELSALDASRHWQLLAGEGIFAVPAALPAAADGSSTVEAPPEVEEIETAAEDEAAAARSEAVEEPAPEPAVAEPEPEDSTATPPVEAAPEEPAEPEAAEPAAEVPEGEAAGQEPATATLGELYLKQGHLQEAGRIFRRVLEADPGNPRALAGLDRLAGRPRRTKPLTAADLLAVKSASGRIPEGLTAKKVLVLGNYVKHLRAADEHVH